jgi:uncharacterized repeat protein (TIGR01451 family)
MRAIHRSALLVTSLLAISCSIESTESIGKNTAALSTFGAQVMMPEFVYSGQLIKAGASLFNSDNSPHNDVTMTTTFTGKFTASPVFTFPDPENLWTCGTTTPAADTLVVTCHADTIRKNGFNIDLTPTADGTVTGHLVLTEGGVTISTSDASTVVKPPTDADLGTYAYTDAKTPLGAPAAFFFSAYNNGPAVAKNAKLTIAISKGTGKFTGISSFPEPVPCTVGETTVTCALGDLAPFSKFATVNLMVSDAPLGPLALTGIVTSDTPDPNSFNNSVTPETMVYTAKSTDLAVSMTAAPDPAAFNKPLTYTIVVKNNGPDASSSVELADFLPSILTFKSVTTTQGACAGGPFVQCNLGALASGASATVKVVTTATEGGVASNFVSVNPSWWNDEVDPNFGNNFAETVTTIKGPSIPVVTTSSQARDEVAFGTYVPCMNDFVVLNGTLHSSFHTTWNKSSGFSLFESVANPQGINGYALNAHVAYQATGVTKSSQKFTGYFPPSFKFQNNFRIIGKGSAGDLLVHQVLQVNVAPDGTVKVNVDKYDFECR